METTRHTTHHPTDRGSLERVCVVTFTRAGGPGGQHRNRRETAVRVHHPPSGLTIVASERRSQARNRELAFRQLATRLRKLNHVRKPRLLSRPLPSAIEARLRAKRRRATTKALRRALDARASSSRFQS